MMEYWNNSSDTNIWQYHPPLSRYESHITHHNLTIAIFSIPLVSSCIWVWIIALIIKKPVVTIHVTVTWSILGFTKCSVGDNQDCYVAGLCLLCFSNYLLCFGAMLCTSAYHAQIMLYKFNISSLAYAFYI